MGRFRRSILSSMPSSDTSEPLGVRPACRIELCTFRLVASDRHPILLFDHEFEIGLFLCFLYRRKPSIGQVIPCRVKIEQIIALISLLDFDRLSWGELTDYAQVTFGRQHRQDNVW